MKPKNRKIPKGYAVVKLGDELRLNDLCYGSALGWHRTGLKGWILDASIKNYYGPYIRKVTRK